MNASCSLSRTSVSRPRSLLGGTLRFTPWSSLLDPCRPHRGLASRKNRAWPRLWLHRRHRPWLNRLVYRWLGLCEAGNFRRWILVLARGCHPGRCHSRRNRPPFHWGFSPLGSGATFSIVLKNLTASNSLTARWRGCLIFTSTSLPRAVCRRQAARRHESPITTV